ncbi:DUF6082 family protein [Streptomyces albidoflavus]|uniref:DUF6082 family protein n=1 Tax=Streptomyces albidoflavus TaxID=1886 RepID=UPI0033F4BE19
MGWLDQVATNEELAKAWAPEDVTPKDYMQLMQANRQLCALSLRDRLGLVTEVQRHLLVAALMKNEVMRRYWERFGGFREEEAATGKCKQALYLTDLLDRASKSFRTAA